MHHNDATDRLKSTEDIQDNARSVPSGLKTSGTAVLIAAINASSMAAVRN
jgi:hypothetical protein